MIIMPVDIEQWRVGIGNFNGCCQYPVARIESRVYNDFSAIVMSACVSINPWVYFKSQYYFTFLARFFYFYFFTFCFVTPNTENILFKDKYFALLYWTRQLYLLTNFIYLYVKYYQLFQCFVLYVLFTSPFTSAWRYREKSWSTGWSN